MQSFLEERKWEDASRKNLLHYFSDVEVLPLEHRMIPHYVLPAPIARLRTDGQMEPELWRQLPKIRDYRKKTKLNKGVLSSNKENGKSRVSTRRYNFPEFATRCACKAREDSARPGTGTKIQGIISIPRICVAILHRAYAGAPRAHKAAEATSHAVWRTQPVYIPGSSTQRRRRSFRHEALKAERKHAAAGQF